jgi:type IV pilus assembly protein PilX
MRSPRRIPFKPVRIVKQRGVSLFFALVCLVSIMLAAVALVRSVDTSTMISGNLAFQQSATASADAGVDAAMEWLAAKEKENTTKNVLTDASHYFNKNDGANGYWSSLDPNKSLTATGGFLWNTTDSKGLTPAVDSSGNETRFIIQRLCGVEIKPVREANCLYSGAIQDNNGQNIPLPQEVCKGDGCPAAGQTPQIRITSRTSGPKNTRSYVQTFVY